MEAAAAAPESARTAPQPVALSPREHTAQFALLRLCPDVSGRVAASELEAAYRDCCRATATAERPPSDLAHALADLIKSAAGLHVEHLGREPVIVGARLVA